MRRAISAGNRLVVKVGSSSLVEEGNRIDESGLSRVVKEVAGAWEQGYPTVLVSSGAVAAGLPALGLEARPTDLPTLQVAAAVGQSRLMHRYSEAFADRGLIAGQILLTRDVLAHREQYLHARQALSRMLTEGIVPVVNENDTVGIDGLRLGDNDRLAAIVSHLVQASLLVILTDTAGLFASDPRVGDAEFLAAVDHDDVRLDELHGGNPLGSGGVGSKVAAARIAAFSGIPTVVASAWSDIGRIAAGGDVGTWVEPRPTSLPARKLWIAFCQPAAGAVTIDEGAVAALEEGGRSLLAVGVTGAAGTFQRGDTVDVSDTSGRIVARGLARMGSDEVRSRAGQRRGREVIHRDELVVFGLPAPQH